MLYEIWHRIIRLISFITEPCGCSQVVIPTAEASINFITDPYEYFQMFRMSEETSVTESYECFQAAIKTAAASVFSYF